MALSVSPLTTSWNCDAVPAGYCRLLSTSDTLATLPAARPAFSAASSLGALPLSVTLPVAPSKVTPRPDRPRFCFSM